MALNHVAADPYALSSSDHPGLVLVSQPLTETNYHSWSRAMRMALNSKKKLGFVDGSIPRPGEDADPALLESWQCTNDIVSSWLLNSISKDLTESIIYCDSAASMWSDLKSRFLHGNGPRIFQLKREIATFHQGNLTVTQYFSKIKTLWAELSCYKPNFVCNCGGYGPMQDFFQREYVMSFLMGLDESFSSIRGQILAMEPLPDINKAFSLVVQEEKQREVANFHSIPETNQTVFTVRNSAKSLSDAKTKTGKKDRPLCSHCGVLGHTMDRCYKLHGFPPGYGKGKGKQAVNYVSDTQQEEDSTSVVDTAAPMTQAQYQHLVYMLSAQQLKPVPESNSTTMVPAGIVYSANHVKSTFKPHTWIIDSGATSHIASTLSGFLSHTPLMIFL